MVELIPSMSFKVIPGGKFMMGDSTGQGDKNEQPAHEAEVSTFLITDTVITYALWKSVYEWAVKSGYQFDNEGKGDGKDHPVTDINWYDCVKWCNALSERNHLKPCYYTDIEKKEVYRRDQASLNNAMVDWEADGYCLPVEVEWERAARGGLPGHHFPWPSKGDNFEEFMDSTKANFRLTFNPGSVEGATPVKAYPSNGFGLFDMVGIWQWIWDKWSSGWYSDPKSGEKDCRGPEIEESGESLRVARNYFVSPGSKPSLIRRSGFLRHIRNRDVGFRVVKHLGSMRVEAIGAEQALLFDKWIREREGVLVWRKVYIDGSNVPYCQTPVVTEEGIPASQPHWKWDKDPVAVVTDRSQIIVVTGKEKKRFRIALIRSGLSFDLTYASSKKVRNEIEKAGKGSWYEFDYSTQQCVIYVTDKEITLDEFMKQLPAADSLKTK